MIFLRDVIVKRIAYVSVSVCHRKMDVQESAKNGERSMMTPRQLLSILRLSQGCARIRFSKVVEMSDIDEAIRLVKASKESLEDESSNNGSGPGIFI